MDNSFQHKSIFQQNIWVSVFALTAAVVWGWAYPLIKMGFAEFGIQSSMTESKMLFAGIRFFFSGLIILLSRYSKLVLCLNALFGCRF